MIPAHPTILILIPLLNLVIPACSSRPSPVPPNLRVFREPLNPNPLQLVVVHDNQVVVGGRNTLYHFDADLKLRGKVSTGPRLDNPACLYPTFPCNYTRTTTDDDIRLLLVIAQDEDEDEPLLLNCGTLYQGACRVRPLTHIAGPRSAWVGPLNETVGLVGSPLGSTVGFVSTAGTLWTGATYDEDRPVSKTAVASRELLQGDEGFRLEYSHETDTEFTGLHFDPKYRRVYKVDYIHAFEHENFAYFLQTQRVAIESENFETRLARVCSSDPTFFSYTELPLRCHYGLEVYALATAAYVGPAGDLLGRRLKLPGGGAAQVLYVSFVKPMPGHGSGVTDRTKGSVVCSFPMSTVVEAFTNATKQCFRAEIRTQLLKHVVGSEMACKSQDSVKIDDNFCGSGLNHYIGGRESLPGGFRTYLDAQVTSLVVTLQKGKAVAVAGTDTGDVYKIHLEKRKQLYALNIADGEEDKAVRRSNALDASHENVYFLVGDRAVKFPVGSCSVYRDCGSCLNTDDPLGCGWCGDHCASLEECERPAALMTVTCPPVIYEVSGFHSSHHFIMSLIFIAHRCNSSFYSYHYLNSPEAVNKTLITFKMNTT
ncbi:hypothetical protein JTE90_020274 [Oedothorax gibbosus]|uniref:Sema domain-containing protein n=1 Tax=Oedothorax gibbosus TaxID=931172 RepID=A0AAV6VMH2_9ARAC|nr:hypothetical protein JTE90_020274 [Oedothorax gibbosus]